MKININIGTCNINHMEMNENNIFEESSIQATGVKLMLQEGFYLKASTVDGKNVIVTVETEGEASVWTLKYDRTNMKTAVQDPSTGLYWTFVPEEQGKEVQLLPKTDDCNYIQMFNSVAGNDGFSLLDETRRFVSYSKLPPVAGEVLYAEKESIFIIVMTAIDV